MHPDKLRYVNTNKASSGLREKVILTNLVGKIWHQNVGWGGEGGEAPLGGPYLPKEVHAPSWVWLRKSVFLCVLQKFNVANI